MAIASKVIKRNNFFRMLINLSDLKASVIKIIGTMTMARMVCVKRIVR